MKQKYPAEAFALGIVLFSAGMREAFAAGILVILTVVFAEFLKNLLEKCSLLTGVSGSVSISRLARWAPPPSLRACGAGNPA